MFSTKKLHVPYAGSNQDLAVSALSQTVDSCGTPGNGAWIDVATRMRCRLWELPAHLYCSIVGTCLTLAEARKFAVRHDGPDAAKMDDLALHERLVGIAGDPNGGARDLHKHLDRRHDVALRRFDKAKDDEALLAAWERSLAEGDIPGAYWAALTHRSATSPFRLRAFGDVHMLSHLVGVLTEQGNRLRDALARANDELERGCKLTARVMEELESLEAGIGAIDVGSDDLPASLEGILGGRTVFYCGGRPGQVETIRKWVERCRGTFLHHDGGKEERKGLVASQLQSADIVVFPVDCVSHDAMGQIKRLCGLSGKPYRALRTSSLGSFVHALREDAAVPA